MDYERLHILCLNCKNFGHSKKGGGVKELIKGQKEDVRNENWGGSSHSEKGEDKSI